MKNKWECSSKLVWGLICLAFAAVAFYLNIAFEYSIPTIHDAELNVDIYAFSIGPQISYVMLAISAIAVAAFFKLLESDCSALAGFCAVSVLFGVDCGIIHPILIKLTDMKYSWNFGKILTVFSYVEALLAVLFIALFIIRLVSGQKGKWNNAIMACCIIIGTLLVCYTALVQYTYGIVYVCAYVAVIALKRFRHAS